MKTTNIVVAAYGLSNLSFGVFAAEPVTASQAQNMNKIGVVSAAMAHPPSMPWKRNWLRKPRRPGASGYSITSATNNK